MGKRRLSYGRLFSIFLGTLIGSITYFGLASTLTVPDDFPSIQAAIDAAEPGAVIVILPGEYSESVVLAKDLTIEGNGARLIGNAERPVITIIAGRVSLNNLAIQGGSHGVLVGVPPLLASFRYPPTWAIPHVKILNCDLSQSSNKVIVAFGSSTVEIIGCNIESSEGFGISFRDASHGIIERSKIYIRVFEAVEIANLASAEVSACVISGQPGILNSGRAVVEDCTFESAHLYSDYAVQIFEKSYTRISRSIIYNWYTGIQGSFVEGDFELELIDNVIINNKYGVEISGRGGKVYGTGNVMYGNGIDMIGNLPSGLRAPLVVPEEREIYFPDPRYPTLQHAVDALIPGGRLVLQAGDYDGGITIDKSAVIEAKTAGKVTITGSNGISVLGEASVTLRGLTIATKEIALQLGAQSKVDLVDCSIRGTESLWAVLIGGNSILRVINSDIYGNAWYALFAHQHGKCLLEKCAIHDNGCGIACGENAELEIIDCAVTANRKGAVVEDTATGIITKTTFTSNAEEGLFVLNWAVAKLYNVEFKENGVGIYIGGFAFLECRNVVLRSNGFGIATWTASCGIGYAYKLFLGCVTGQVCASGNLHADLCPPYPAFPWPDAFLKGGEQCE